MVSPWVRIITDVDNGQKSVATTKIITATRGKKNRCIKRRGQSTWLTGPQKGPSVKFRIVSRLTVEPLFKHQLEQWLHSDAADRLHLRCCGSQKITEVRCALLGSDRSWNHAPEPAPAPQKVDTILNYLPSMHILIQSNACVCIKICSNKPLSIEVNLRGSCFHWITLDGAQKNHEDGVIFLKNR